MPEFDLYDDRWHDCWLAATSVARLRKKQVDVNIHQRVERLLQDHGPASAKPLSLRIYGTLIKGFCVINNERLRSLFCDCERVVLMFARQPFAEGDNKIRLPAAKRPKLEAKWVQMALADGPSFQEFDWTQAPLEEGTLLRLGGGAPQELMPLSLDFGAPNDGLGGAAPALLQPAGAEVLAPALPAEGWLPRVVGEEQAHPELPEGLAAPPAGGLGPLLDPAQSQLVPLEPCGLLLPDAGLQPPPEVMLQAEAGFEALAQPARRAREPLVKIKPGTVYGFDSEPVMASTEYDAWQQDSSDLSNPRMRATGYAAQMAGLPENVERLGPRLCLILEPDEEVLQRLNLALVRHRAATGQQQQQLPGPELPVQQEPPPAAGPVPQGAAGGAAELLAGNPAAPAVGEAPPPLPPPWEAVEFPHGPVGAMGATPEGQEDRTAEVGRIIHSCLRSGSDKVASFAQLVPPSGADRATAACTFAALLALATAGDLRVRQPEPYGPILVSEAA